MTPKNKGHDTGCPIAFSLDAFGDRWTLLLLRDLLLFGKQRYGEFLAAEEAIASNILSDRLKRLETMEIIERAPDPNDGRMAIYQVTDKGRSLIPVVLEIAAWGAKYDENTRAPKSFPEHYYANRAAFHADPHGELSKLFAEESS